MGVSPTWLHHAKQQARQDTSTLPRSPSHIVWLNDLWHDCGCVCTAQEASSAHLSASDSWRQGIRTEVAGLPDQVFYVVCMYMMQAHAAEHSAEANYSNKLDK